MWTSLSLRPIRGTMQKQRRLVRLAQKRLMVVYNGFKFPVQRSVFSPGNDKDPGCLYVCSIGKANKTELPR